MEEDKHKPQRKKKLTEEALSASHPLIKNKSTSMLLRQQDEFFANIRALSESYVYSATETLCSPRLSNMFQDVREPDLNPGPTWDDLSKKDEEIADQRGKIKELERLVKLLQNNKGADYIR